MHASKKIYGSVSINMPAPYPFVISAFSVLFLMLILYALNMDFTGVYEVKGYLNAKLGTSQVYALRPGIIGRSFVVNGQPVSKGDALFRIDTITDKASFSAEQALLQKRLTKVERNIERKSHYLNSIAPLLAKHYVSLTTYQNIRDQLMALEGSKHEINLALMRHQQSKSYLIRAPITGVVASLEAHAGQHVGLTHALLTLLPEKAELVAQLYVPVAKAGFLRSGSSINLRYDAYPYQHFGVARARIQTISQSILSDRDELKPIRIGKPYYKVVAHLDKQFILLDRQKHFLQQGMTCTAIINGTHKKLWQWMFDPIHVMP